MVGDFVLFANYPQIIKEAINQAQAVELNLEQSDNYQTAISQIEQPHIGISYVNVPRTSAWLNKQGNVNQLGKDSNFNYLAIN